MPASDCVCHVTNGKDCAACDRALAAFRRREQWCGRVVSYVRELAELRSFELQRGAERLKVVSHKGGRLELYRLGAEDGIEHFEGYLWASK